MRRATCASVRRCAALLLATTTALNPLQRWQYEQTQKTPVRYSGARDLASLSPVFWRWVADADQPSALACPELEPARARRLAAAAKDLCGVDVACDAVAGVSTLTVADRPPGRRFDAPSETDTSGDAARAAGAAAARRRTEAFVERVLVRMRQCPFTGSKSRAAVGLEEFGVDAAPILYGYSAAGDVAGLLADVWAVLDGFRRAGPGGYSSILVACPAFDGDFERWTREIFPALEATLLAAEASRELAIVCFHPDYATPDPEWLATHRFGHMYAPPTLRRWLEDADADLAGALDDDDLQYLGSYMRRTPVATINVLWSAQLEAAERKRESKALYARNLRRLHGEGRGALEEAARRERRG